MYNIISYIPSVLKVYSIDSFKAIIRCLELVFCVKSIYAIFGMFMA